MRAQARRFPWHALLVFVLLSIPAVLAAQPSPHDWYEFRVEQRPPIQIITITTDDGPVRIVLPEHIVGGEWFYGTVELPSEGASTAPQSYVLQFAGQSTHANQQGFSWQAPRVAADTDVVLLVSDFRGVRVAQVVITVQARAPADETDGTLYIPKVVQSGRAMAVSGTFDGKGTNISLIVGNTPRIFWRRPPTGRCLRFRPGCWGTRTTYSPRAVRRLQEPCAALPSKKREALLRCSTASKRPTSLWFADCRGWTARLR